MLNFHKRWLSLRAARHRGLVGVSLILVAAGVPEISVGDDPPQDEIQAISANGLYHLEINRLSESHFTIRQDGRVVASGDIEISGNWKNAFINDSGSVIVLHDDYAGFDIYDTSGCRLRQFAGDDLLTIREQWTRPYKFGCHPEGHWGLEKNRLSFVSGGTAIELRTHTGRAIVVNLSTLQVEHAELDIIQLAVVVGLVITLPSTVWLSLRARGRNASVRTATTASVT